MVKGFGMLPNKSLQGKGALYIQRHCLLRLCGYHSTLLAVVWRFFFIAAGKSGKFADTICARSGGALSPLYHRFTTASQFA